MTEPSLLISSPSQRGNRTRRQRASNEAATSPSDNSMANLQNFFDIFDDSESAATGDEVVFQRAYEALYGADAVIVTYAPAPMHSVEGVQTYHQLYQMFASCWRRRVPVELVEVNSLATSVIEYTYHLSNEVKVCTATFLDGKILSCVEKKIALSTEEQVPGQHAGPLRKEQEGSMLLSDLTTATATTEPSGSSYGSFANDSGSFETISISNLNRGTSLETVQQSGGSIFINQCQDMTNVTVLTEQEGGSIDLELIDFPVKPSSSFFSSEETIELESISNTKEKKNKGKKKSKDKDKSATKEKKSKSRNKSKDNDKEKKGKEKKRKSTSSTSSIVSSVVSNVSADSAPPENLSSESALSTTETTQEVDSSSHDSFDPENSRPRLLLREKSDPQQPVVLCRVQVVREENEKAAQDEDAAPAEPLSLWEQLEHDKAKQASAQDFTEKEIYHIDGCEPMFSTDTCAANHYGCDFYPRYKFDPTTQKVHIWNGTQYEPFMDASSQDIGTKERKEAHENMLPKLQQEIGGGSLPTEPDILPECVAHVAKRGNSRGKDGGDNNEKNLRAKIKIPIGGDPALMIVLTVLSDQHRDLFKFTKLRLRGNPTASKMLLQRSLSMSKLPDAMSPQRSQYQQQKMLMKATSARNLTSSTFGGTLKKRNSASSHRRASMEGLTTMKLSSQSEHGHRRRSTMDTLASGGSRNIRNNRRNQLTRQALLSDPKESS
mmetsp:Transcript_16944/g.36989  ORF Transcript_16944/g.36989 Transcript_16944/m.36989 type:complete len:720 (+) Transcript_16944:131-2290(+)